MGDNNKAESIFDLLNDIDLSINEAKSMLVEGYQPDTATCLTGNSQFKQSLPEDSDNNFFIIRIQLIRKLKQLSIELSDSMDKLIQAYHLAEKSAQRMALLNRQEYVNTENDQTENS